MFLHNNYCIMKKINSITILSIMIAALSAFSCTNNNKSTEKNDRKTDSTKNVFKNIEFGMGSKELIDLGFYEIFDESEKPKVNQLFTMSIKIDSANFKYNEAEYGSFISPVKIIYNNIISFYRMDSIGKYEYETGVSLYNDKLFVLSIFIKNDQDNTIEEKVKNIVDLVSIKNGQPKIDGKILNKSEAYDLFGNEDSTLTIKCEWVTKFKIIRLYKHVEKYYSQNPLGSGKYYQFNDKKYVLEFYNDKPFIQIMNNCHDSIVKIEKRKRIEKVEASKAF